MMCAGLTVWSPLVRANTGPGKKVAIVGMGGLGHFAVLNAADMTNEFDISQYLSILKVGGQFHQVGLPDEALPEIKAQMFM
jgi:alcohol dehydrogenase (NADP+)